MVGDCDIRRARIWRLPSYLQHAYIVTKACINVHNMYVVAMDMYLTLQHHLKCMYLDALMYFNSRSKCITPAVVKRGEGNNFSSTPCHVRAILPYLSETCYTRVENHLIPFIPL